VQRGKCMGKSDNSYQLGDLASWSQEGVGGACVMRGGPSNSFADGDRTVITATYTYLLHSLTHCMLC
jgi:hypothetical protein